MALQMRPHFIYNVLTSIYYLCAQDPARAQQATLDCTNYLRANFAAVASQEPVPFTEELNHTRAYLAVESIRFGDRLQISLDCPHTAFRLPPLTLQPLAENAVKHGVDPELPPLEVHVTTRHEDGASVVTVEDTGPGFDLASTPDTGASALTNLTERLETAGIGFSVLPREGGGTIATIIVPDEEK
jgi:sensor histidine kinase YesM